MSRVLGMADAIRATGVSVMEVAGWQTRGNPTLRPLGIVHHHDVSHPDREASMRRLITDGRSDLLGPLYNVWIDRAGVAWIIASGKANHAGRGGWQGLAGNSTTIGLCLANNGTGEPYPPAQMTAWERTTIGLNRLVGVTAEFNCGHKEWAPTRKIDPAHQNMERFRSTIKAGFNLDALSPKEVEDLRGILASMYRVGSNPTFPQYLITDYRRRN